MTDVPPISDICRFLYEHINQFDGVKDPTLGKKQQEQLEYAVWMEKAALVLLQQSNDAFLKIERAFRE